MSLAKPIEKVQITELLHFEAFLVAFLRFPYTDDIFVSNFYHFMVKITCQTIA